MQSRPKTIRATAAADMLTLMISDFITSFLCGGLLFSNPHREYHTNRVAVGLFALSI